MAGVNNVNRTSTTPVTSGQELAARSTQKSGQLNGLQVKTSAAPSEKPASRARFTKQVDSLNAAALPQPTARTQRGNVDGVTPATGRTTAAAARSGPTSLQVVGTAAFRQRVAQDLARFAPGTTVDAQGFVHAATRQQAGHTQGYALINQLLSNPNRVTIGFTANNAFTQSGAGAQGTPTRPNRGSAASVLYDPNLRISLPTLQRDGRIRDEGIPSAVVLAHELIHAAHAQKGTIDRTNVTRTFTDGNRRFSETWRFEEFRTTGFRGFRQGSEPTENSIRAELGLNPRATYLDRSGWRPVNGITAGAPTAGRTNGIAAGSWEGGRMCNCFGCA